MADPFPFSLSPQVEKELQEIERVDLLIGIPSYRHTQTIGNVVQAAGAGLLQFFPSARPLILISEGGSVQEVGASLERVREPSIPILLSPYLIDPSDRLTLPYHGIPERRKALWGILYIAQRLQAKTCVILDSRLSSITPHWIESLARPIWQSEFDYASPVYARRGYEGALVNCLVYPLTRALYGKDIRHPVGGEFAMSTGLISHYLSSEKIWNEPGPLPEIDMSMAITALLSAYPTCQVHLGPRLYEGPPADLSSTVFQVAGSLFQLAETNQAFWLKGLPESHPPTLGTPISQPPNPPPTDPLPMIQSFHRGLRDLLPLWEQALSPETLQDLYPLGSLEARDFRFPTDLWVRVIYDMLLAFHYRTFYWRHLLKSLVPLYLGRLASMIIETEMGSETDIEESIQLLCRRFIMLRPYLVERWR